MELVLNTVWAVLGVALFALWLRMYPREKDSYVEPLIALAMLVVLLFPVISVSDDLWAIQNPAEGDVAIRRDLSHAIMHGIFPAATPPESAFAAGLLLCCVCLLAPLAQAVSPVSRFLLDALDNRPPPTV